MHPYHSMLVASWRREQLLADASAQRRARAAGPAVVPSLRERLIARRTALGYRLMEAGLRLMVADRPPPAEPLPDRSPQGSRWTEASRPR